MLEIPEAMTMAVQIREYLGGKTIETVESGNSTHKFAWFSDTPEEYHRLLRGCRIEGAEPRGGLVEIDLGDYFLLGGDGAHLTYLAPGDPLPDKYLLLIGLTDGSKLYMTVQMYGGMWCYEKGAFPEDHYMAGSYRNPSPLTGEFDRAYFDGLLFNDGILKKSAKAALATEQRIPGLGNGVLQDILFAAGIHPKRKLSSLESDDRDRLFRSLKETLGEMTKKGGRDTEKDLLGRPGRYEVFMDKRRAGKACPRCGGTVVKTAYMGGSVYFCPECQKE
ncbi:MAG: hypothetical protein JXA95_04655 [Spirochaetales bacterium]|nr:hypothetical protein [Spirochaetales bacterium]